MPRKAKGRTTRREPTSEEEGQQILIDAEKAGQDYVKEQVGSPYFRDWVYEQMVEAERMRRQDPDSVIPSDTPSGARKVARNMLQQLEWDTKRDLERRSILELSGAKGVFDVGSADWVRDKYGITYEEVSSAFFGAFDEALKSPSTRDWLTDLVLEMSEEVRGGEGAVSEAKHAAGLSDEQRAAIDEALRPYGARLTTDDLIAKGEKVLGVRVEVQKGRLRMVMASNGNLLASFPASRLAAGVADFVEKFWYWKPESVSEHRSTREAHRVRDYEAVDPKGRHIAGPFTDYGKAKREAERARGYVKYVTESSPKPRTRRS